MGAGGKGGLAFFGFLAAMAQPQDVNERIVRFLRGIALPSGAGASSAAGVEQPSALAEAQPLSERR
jgi:hypothetical protein